MKSGASAARSLARATHSSGADRMEAAGLDFHERVNAAFDELESTAPDRVRTVVSSKTKARTAKLVFQAVADVVGWDADRLPFDDAYFEAANKIHGAGKSRRARGSRGGRHRGAKGPGGQSPAPKASKGGAQNKGAGGNRERSRARKRKGGEAS
jgi:dTMP kinase